jgi:hypothetical protein
MSDPYFSGDMSARRTEGKIFGVCIQDDARRLRQGEVDNELPRNRLIVS